MGKNILADITDEKTIFNCMKNSILSYYINQFLYQQTGKFHRNAI